MSKLCFWLRTGLSFKLLTSHFLVIKKVYTEKNRESKSHTTATNTVAYSTIQSGIREQ